MASTYGFLVDASRCTGCKTCVMACEDYNDLDASCAYRRVWDYEGGTWERDLSLIHISEPTRRS